MQGMHLMLEEPNAAETLRAFHDMPWPPKSSETLVTNEKLFIIQLSNMYKIFILQVTVAEWLRRWT